MADETTTPTPQAPPAQPAPVPPPAQPAEDIAKLKAELDQYRSRDTEAARKAREAEAAKLDEQRKSLEAKLQKAETAAKRQAAVNALSGLKRQDTFLPLVLDKVALDDDGKLTPDSAKALETWRTENPELFDVGPKPGAHPQGGGRVPSKEDEIFSDPAVAEAARKLNIPLVATEILKRPNFAEAQRILGIKG